MSRFFILFLVLISGAAAADLKLSAEGAASYAVAHNPSLAAARWRIDEARGRWRQAGRLANPEVEVELSRNIAAPEGAWGVGLTQKFPITARLRLEKAVAQGEIAAAEAELKNEERKLGGEVRAVVVKILAQREERALQETQASHSKELNAFLTKRVEAGEIGALDLAQGNLETKQIEAELLRIQATEAVLLEELRPVLGVRPGQHLEITGALSAPERLPGSGGQATNRADYLAAQAQIAMADRSVELARANKWEDVGVGLTAQRERSEDAPDGFQSDTFVGLKFSVPLPLWNRNEGKIAETVAAAARARQEAEAVAATIRGEAASARVEMAALAKVVAKLDEELIPAAVKIEEQFRASYAAGQLPLPEVLRARSKRIELARQRVETLRDYHLARARYQTALGTPILSKNFKTKK